MEKYTPARTRAHLTVGASVRVLRELQEMSQAELAEATGLSQPAISAIEKDRVTLTVDRAKRIALALKVHPSVILFPDWEAEAKAMVAAASARSQEEARAGADAPVKRGSVIKHVCKGTPHKLLRAALGRERKVAHGTARSAAPLPLPGSATKAASKHR